MALSEAQVCAELNSTVEYGAMMRRLGEPNPFAQGTLVHLMAEQGWQRQDLAIRLTGAEHLLKGK